MIEVNGLKKSFKQIKAVDGIEFQVEEGEVFGFLGPNGAGKTTTIKMLCTILRQDAGSVRVNGFDTLKDPAKVRKSLGIIFQDPSLDNDLTIAENLYFHSKLFHVPGKVIKDRIQMALKLVELWDRRNDLVKILSGGMKRRVEIARGILHEPKILFLDEPTIGLDPQTRKHIWEFIYRLQKEKNITVFLTTHYMEEAEFCRRIAIIDKGQIIALDTPANLKKRVMGDLIFLKSSDNNQLQQKLSVEMGIEAYVQDEFLCFIAPDSGKFIPRLFNQYGSLIIEIDLKKTSLDDVFIKLTGKEIREEEAAPRERLKHRMKMHRRI